MTVYTYTPDGHSFAGTAKWKVTLPSGQEIGHVASIPGKRGSSWSAVGPSQMYSKGGHRNREAAATWLESIFDPARCPHDNHHCTNPRRHPMALEEIVCDDCGAQLGWEGDSLEEVTT